MSELAALLRKPIEVEVEGVTLRFSRLNDRIRLALEEWAEGVVEATYRKLADRAPDEAARLRLFAELEKIMVERRYAFGKPAFLELMNSLDGVCTAAHELLRANHPGVTRDEVMALVSEHPAVGEGLAKAMQGDGTAAKKKGAAPGRKIGDGDRDGEGDGT